MQLLHLGFWKTATTGIQRLIFKPDTRRPYYGVNGEQSDSWRRDWIRKLAERQVTSEWSGRDFVFSDESAMVRLGGRAGLPAAAEAISSSFNDPRVLLTVREPADLLISAYFQSVAVRRRAVGAGDVGPSYRFVTFPKWWRELRDQHAVSLAGLLDYEWVDQTLCQVLGRDRVTLFSLELMRSDPVAFQRTMEGLGCDGALVANFIDHPNVNSTNARSLRRSCGPLMRLGKMPQRIDHPIIDRFAYLGREIDLKARYPEVVAEIRAAYPYRMWGRNVPHEVPKHTGD